MGIAQELALAQAGKHPRLVAKLTAGYLWLGETQPLPGYCVFVADPITASLNDLTLPERETYLREMSLVGDALREALGAARVNYELWGNLDPTLHAHIVPRFASEADKLRTQIPREAYDWAGARTFDPAIDEPVIEKLRAALKARIL